MLCWVTTVLAIILDIIQYKAKIGLKQILIFVFEYSVMVTN